MLWTLRTYESRRTRRLQQLYKVGDKENVAAASTSKSVPAQEARATSATTRASPSSSASSSSAAKPQIIEPHLGNVAGASHLKQPWAQPKRSLEQDSSLAEAQLSPSKDHKVLAAERAYKARPLQERNSAEDSCSDSVFECAGKLPSSPSEETDHKRRRVDSSSATAATPSAEARFGLVAATESVAETPAGSTARVFTSSCKETAPQRKHRMCTSFPAADHASPPASPFKPKHKTEAWVQKSWPSMKSIWQTDLSEVHLVKDQEHGELRILKRLNKKAVDFHFARRKSHLSFHSEAQLMKSMQHEGIVRLYDVFETRTQLHLLMEHLPGGNLLHFIKKHGCMLERRACRFFRALCLTVRHLHMHGVVHRDLKPENILLTSEDPDLAVPKLADFGISRRAFQIDECMTFVGTLPYLAPEVWRVASSLAPGGEGGKAPQRSEVAAVAKGCTARDSSAKKCEETIGYGKAVDMWSLGVILYIMLSGMPPFDASCGPRDLAEQIMRGDWEFDVPQWRKVSDKARGLVRGCLTVNPADRLSIDAALSHEWLRDGSV
mmetsp:Transcript_104405/g.261737  ORF Transcript_104405/g.261737 Transcript_104405/m.261737 type:complete len:551 (+) Transcript_104405:167-1819(+)